MGDAQITWEIEQEFSEEKGVLMNVWGNSGQSGWNQEQVWSVGGQPDQGRMWAWNRGQWEDLDLPSGPLLNWIHGRDGHLWVVGNQGRALRKIGDEGEWEVFTADTDHDLWGVWVVSTDEVWAVGGNAVGEDDPDPVLTRFDGTQWTRIPLPELDRNGVRSLFKIWGNGQQLFAVGMKGVIIGDLGQGWEQLPVVPVEGSPPNSEDLISLWGSGGEVIAVGGRSNGVIARWNGQEWKSQTLAGVPGLNGVWVDEFGKATTVGVRGSIFTFEPSSFEKVRYRTPVSDVLHAVWSDGQSLWSVGGTLDNTPPWLGVILHAIHPL